MRPRPGGPSQSRSFTLGSRGHPRRASSRMPGLPGGAPGVEGRSREVPQLRLVQAPDPARPSRVPGLRSRLGAGRRLVGAVKLPDAEPILLSACLAGIPCTHAAEAKTRAWALDLVAEGRAVAVCPEVAGGLPIPRPEAEIDAGAGGDVLDGKARVVSVDGQDVTANYVSGAEAALGAA